MVWYGVVLCRQTLSVIFKSGFSRIPVFAKDHNDVIGLLFTKDLIFIDPDDETPLKNFVQIFGRAVTVRVLYSVWFYICTAVSYRYVHEYVGIRSIF